MQTNNLMSIGCKDGCSIRRNGIVPIEAVTKETLE